MFFQAYDSTLPPMNGPIDTPEDATGSRSRHPAPAAEPGRPYPLTQEEWAIWDAHAAELTGAHHRLYTAHIKARVDGERLELALDRLVERHPALRTTFRTGPAGPVRWIRSRADFQLEFVDAQRWRREELDEIVRLTSRQPMDLAASVFRAVLFSRGTNDHVLLLVAHRIAVERRQLRLMLRDLRALYAGDPLPPPPTSPSVGAHPSPFLSSPLPGMAPPPPRGRLLLPAPPAREEQMAHLCRQVDHALTRDPERIALVVDGEPLTCGELDALANRLARLIRSEGVDPRANVAVELPPSAISVAACIAVLRIGATCVPAGFTVPNPTGGAAPAVAPSACIDAGGEAPTGSAAPPIRLSIDEITASLEAISSQPPGHLGGAEDVAVIALAPRQGRTMAVPLSHSATGRLIASLRTALGIEPEDRVLCGRICNAATLILDLLLPLTAGATVVLASPASLGRPEELARILQRDRISHFRGDAGQWAGLARIGWPGSRALRAVCDARRLTPDLAAFLAARVGRLHALYGDPETTLCCANAAVQPDGGPVLHRPLPGAVFHLLDGQLCPVRAGEEGSVFVGGASVARGYVEKGERVPELFLPDPFTPDGRGRLFNTGDRARARPDGSIEFIRFRDA